jgi:hypothetical protein
MFDLIELALQGSTKHQRRKMKNKELNPTPKRRSPGNPYRQERKLKGEMHKLFAAQPVPTMHRRGR